MAKVMPAQFFYCGWCLQSLAKPQDDVDSWFNILWSYLSIAFASFFFQGMLDMHALLDNPYGNHCCKFPLKSEVAEMLCATRTLLCCGDSLPLMFSDIFQCRGPSSAGQPTALLRVQTLRAFALLCLALIVQLCRTCQSLLMACLSSPFLLSVCFCSCLDKGANVSCMNGYSVIQKHIVCPCS
jgi:hypothetical protein